MPLADLSRYPPSGGGATHDERKTPPTQPDLDPPPAVAPHPEIAG
eukprot:gene19014-13521_t